MCFQQRARLTYELPQGDILCRRALCSKTRAGVGGQQFVETL